MPYRPSLRSIWTLLILSVICYGLYLWCENSHVKKQMPFYSEKVQAARLMERALRVYQDANSENGVFSEQYKDPRLDAIIGQQFTSITTEIGAFEANLVAANPNFAAVAVDLLTQAGAKKGDWVAVGFTGSFPGINTAILCACEVLGITPVTITAVGSSWWGASNPDFTWLDMEKALNEQGVVHSKPIAASMGGINDVAVGLSQIGQDMIIAAIERNHLSLINEKTLLASIDKRMEFFQRAAQGKKYRAYLNVGGGVASLGNTENGRLIYSGLNPRLPIQNYPARGIVHRMNQEGIPIIHFYDVISIAQSYGLGGPQVPLPPVGEGRVFISDRYDLRVAGISAFTALILLVILVKLDSRLFRLREAGVDPDTLM